MRYQKFDPALCQRRSLNYLTSMVDENRDCLPYWLILPNKKPAEAAHCRVDDAELVGSWYEGLSCAMETLNTSEGEETLFAFRRHLMRSWGEHGLRFHEKYPWTHTMHSSFHEMGYILSGLERLLETHPEDEEAEARERALVRGLRSLVISREVRTFWSGDIQETEPIYEFPNDVYLADGGFDLSRHTGRGEAAIRNSIMLISLVKRYERTGDEVALDLARGIANYALGVSRYFNYKMEFFGHVHSAMWVASGLVRLGRATNDARYIEKGKGIYDYVRSLSSSFGWVPEYAQWHPMSEEHCESCCIKDMIECALELIRAGYAEYWPDVNLFSRNQLVENQVDYAGYVTVDNRKADADGITYRDIDRRMIGGYTGGSLPNSISLSKFRSIAGCCAGIAPVAMLLVWKNCATEEDGFVTVNLPMDRETEKWALASECPERGRVSIRLFQGGRARFRLYKYMGSAPKILIDGAEADVSPENGFLITPELAPGQTATLCYPLRSALRRERAAGREYKVLWRGCDVIDILPHGEPMRLFQRDLSVPRAVPKPEDVVYAGAANYGPTQQKA